MTLQVWVKCILALLAGGITASHAQVSLTAFPENLQLYVRDTLTNEGTVQVAGEITQAIDTISLQVTRDNVPIQLLKQALTFPQQVSFDFQVAIPAELAQYGFELYEGTSLASSTLLAEAANVVAGDVILISGQSNAEASRRADQATEAYDVFLRSFGTGNQNPYVSQNLSPTWGVGHVNGSSSFAYNLGQWGARMGKTLIDSLQIPIAILNGARSGRRLSYFLRNDASPADSTTNYGRLLRRVQMGNLIDGARTIIWYHGESDAAQGRTTEEYILEFTDLYLDWLDDLPNLEKVYSIQLRKGCTGFDDEDAAYIQEAQRQIARYLTQTPLMTVKGIPQWQELLPLRLRWWVSGHW